MCSLNTNRPPGDDLPLGTVSVDPTGGPQGPFFDKELSKYGTSVTWKQLCDINPHVWIDDEKRVDYIDMFGTLNAVITYDQLLDYIDRISTDSNITSKHGYHSYTKQHKDIVYEYNDTPFDNYRLYDIFDDHIVDGIRVMFNEFNFASEESTEVRQVYTLKRAEYKTNNIITSIIDTLVNKNTLKHYNDWLYKSNDVKYSDHLHLFRLVKDLPGYINEPHMDKNNLLTMMIFFNFDDENEVGTELLDNDMSFVSRTTCDTNQGYAFPTSNKTSTYHSYTKTINKCRYSLMYNIYENEEQYMSIYDKQTRWDLINRARHQKELKYNMFKTDEIVYNRVDWTNTRVLEHRKDLPYNIRFNKKQGCINYNSLTTEQIDEILVDKELSTDGDYFERVKRLQQSRQADTIMAEKTWCADKPEEYLKLD